MTDQEIERLREKLGSEYSVKRLNGAITVELADIWDGVEFARCVESRKGVVSGREIFEGQVYRITGWENKHVMLIHGFEVGWLPKGIFTPASEDEYVEQLKAKAHELYGEIKDGDRFDSRHLKNGLSGSDELHNIEEWYYEKGTDTLYSAPKCCGGFIIYREGKWAKKIERVRVVPSEIHYPKPDNLDQYVTVELRVIGGLLDSTNSKGAIEELAKCLEDYLNKSE